MRVVLLDVVLGEEKEYPDQGLRLFDWEEGNWSCDCNRSIAWRPIDWAEFTSYCKGGRRYLVIAASEGDFDDLNADYPAQLRDQYRHRFYRIQE